MNRLPDAAHPGQVRLQVSDLSRSLAYYGDTLGLRVLERTSGGAVLCAADGSTPLVELRERSGGRPALRGRVGLFHFAILLPDRPTLGRFAAHMTERGVPMGASDHLVSEALYLRDPDGLGIEVYADRPRTAWERHGGELTMATLPLDLPDLLRSAAAEPWAGMPSGTTVGHVHLHVGDLDAARAFYVDGLGFEVTVSSYPGALFLSAGGYHHHLGLNTWAGPSASSPAADEAQLLEWELVLPDAGAVTDALERLRARGYAGHSPTGATVRDPWGIPLRLTAAQR